VFRSNARFKVVVAGRRWGKTTLALWRLVVTAFEREKRICYYVAPTYRQVKRIAWTKLKAMIPREALSRISEQELSVHLVNGSVIELHGADHADSLRGVGLDAIVLDEYGYMDADLWSLVVRPMLSDRRGSALFISTPRGMNHLFNLYTAAKETSDWQTFCFRTEDGGYVSSDELGAIRTQMDARLYAQEFEASFETLQPRVYRAFDRERNVMDLEMIGGAPILIGMDFNVNPMTAVVAQRAGYQCRVIDEIVLSNSNTQEMMQEINRRYPGLPGVVHPDPSGRARKTSALSTDFCLIRQAGWQVYENGSYDVVDRINTVNARLCDANGRRHIAISPRCRHLIKALEHITYKERTRLPDKSSGFDHITDALGYLIMGVFPILTHEVTMSTVLI
jgi:hypothetical protein